MATGEEHDIDDDELLLFLLVVGLTTEEPPWGTKDASMPAVIAWRCRSRSVGISAKLAEMALQIAS